jgi:hypothetical protein
MGIVEKYSLASTALSMMYAAVIWMLYRMGVSLTNALLMVILSVLILIFLHMGR